MLIRERFVIVASECECESCIVGMGHHIHEPQVPQVLEYVHREYPDHYRKGPLLVYVSKHVSRIAQGHGAYYNVYSTAAILDVSELSTSSSFSRVFALHEIGVGWPHLFVVIRVTVDLPL